jgi:hypothetical protein
MGQYLVAKLNEKSLVALKGDTERVFHDWSY